MRLGVYLRVYMARCFMGLYTNIQVPRVCVGFVSDLPRHQHSAAFSRLCVDVRLCVYVCGR